MHFKHIFGLALLVLLSSTMSSHVAAIPMAFMGNDTTGDVQLEENDFGSYTVGDSISTADEIDIESVSYSYSTTGNLTLQMKLVGTPEFNITTRYSVKITLNPFEGVNSVIRDLTINAVVDAGSSSIGMSWENSSDPIDQRSYNNTVIGYTVIANEITWIHNISDFLPVDEMFVQNTTIITIFGNTESYTDAVIDGATAVFRDEYQEQFPAEPEDLSDENKNPFAIPFPFTTMLVMTSTIVLIYRKIQSRKN